MSNQLPPDLTPDDLAERTELARRDAFIVAIAGLSLANGAQFSPLFDPAFLLLRNFAPTFFVSSQVVIFYFTSLFLAAFTLMVAGVPAALYERFVNKGQTSTTSLVIWLMTLIPLTLPSLAALVNR